MLLYVFAFIIGFIFYKIVLKPIVPLIILKIKLGKQAYFYYYPVIGAIHYYKNSFSKNGDFFGEIRKILRENPEIKVILSNFLDKPFLAFVNQEYIKKMYVEHQNYSKFNFLKYDGLLDKGLLLAEGEEWKFERTLLGQSFTFEKLKSRIPLINRITLERCQLDDKSNTLQFLSWITGEVTIQSFFGELSVGLQINGKPAQLEIVELVNDIMIQRFSTPYTQLKLILFDTKAWRIFPLRKEKEINRRVNQLRETILSLINKRLEQLRQNSQINQEEAQFLDIYLLDYLRQEKENKKNKMNIENVVQQFITLFFAGTDTTATMCNNCLYYLAKYPEAQQEIYDEVKQIVQGSEVKDFHLIQLVKMNAFIQEVFRLKNPAFSPLFRKVKNDFQLLDFQLKKGWIVVQRHDIPSVRNQHFEQADVFDYKRWLNNKIVIQQDDGFVHIPFGAGGRNCIGQHMALLEIKIILCHILRLYQVKIKPNTQVKFAMRFLYCVEPQDFLIYQSREDTVNYD